MKTLKKLLTPRRCSLAAAALSFAPWTAFVMPSAHAATVSWDAELNNGFWDGLQISPSTRSNWSNQDFPGTGDVARFDDASLINTIRATDLAGDWTISSLEFNSPTAGYTLDTTGDRNQLTLNSGAITVEDGNHTIHSNVELAAAATWSVNTGDSLAATGVVSGGFDLTKTGAGLLTVGGANSYGGATNVAAGTLRLTGDDVIPDASLVSLTGTLSLFGRTESIHSLSGTGTLNLEAGTLTILNTSSFDGQMNVAGTGEEAIAYCEQHSPGWIIMDVKMPGRGGLFATREITARQPGTRIVVISQYDDELVADEARACGAIDFLSKDRIADLPEILLGLDGRPATSSETI